MPTSNYLTFYYEAQKFQELLALSPDYLLIQVGFETATGVAVLVTNAEGYKKGDKNPVGSRIGCPVPPCNPGKTLIDADCNTALQAMADKYNGLAEAGKFLEIFK